MARFQVVGQDLQRLLIDLGDGERAYAEGGHLIWKSSSVRMRATLQGGLLGGLRRALTGATFFVLELEGPGQAMLSGFAPGSIIKLDLEPGSSLLAEHRSFLAAESSVKYETKLVGLGFGWLGGEGLWMAKFEGPGRVWVRSISRQQMIMGLMPEIANLIRGS